MLSGYAEALRVAHLFHRRFLFPGERPLAIVFSFLSALGTATAQSPSAVLRGQITDPSAAVVPNATVELKGAPEVVRSAVTDQQGRYVLEVPTPGSYSVRITAPGFDVFETAGIDLQAGQVAKLDARLTVLQAKQSVSVTDTASQIGVDPSQSAGQFILRGSDLDAFSDDPEDLANELQMLAGPSPGPNGPEFFIDGFSGGIMPPKASIREIRVNQNPFSAQYDSVGFGRIEILTKPGADKYHGQASYDFGDRALTARNPYLTSPIVPNYLQENFAGNFSGPLSKRASFFIDSNYRITDENAVVDYTALNSALNPVGVSTAVVAPSRRFSISPRLDYALTANNTLSVRYAWVDIHASNQGIATQTFDLPSQAYTQQNGQQSVQVIDTSVLGASAINELGFQFLRTLVTQTGLSSAPEIDVEGAFTGGGTFPQNYTRDNHWELRDNLTVVHGTHTLQFGGRVREDRLAQQSTTNFNGRFIFSSVSGGDSAIDVYQENQLLASEGYSQAAIADRGFGPSEFFLTAGDPALSVSVFDGTAYVQDDWRLKPNLSISGGLRYEGQSGVSDHADFAPRIGAAWAPGASRGRNPKTTLRAGAGYFYDRFTSTLLANAALLNGVRQVQYIVYDPAFFPNVPDLATLQAMSGLTTGSRVRYQIDPRLKLPQLLQAAAGVERQLPHGMSFAVNYTNSRGIHQLLTRDINAPLPTAFSSLGKAIGPRPYGAAPGDIYQYEGSGVFRQNEVVASFNARINSKFTMYGYYVYNHATSDTDGPGSMPSNPYDLRADYSRAAFDFRHRAFISATTTLPWKIRMAPFIFMQSGLPYNVTSGVDTNGDGNPNDDRPAFAQNPSRLSVIDEPGSGAFDIAPGTLPNAVIVPHNYLQGPGILSLTVRVSRSWSFGESGSGGGNTGDDAVRGGEAIRNGGLSGSSNQSGLGSVFGGVKTARRYTVTLTASFRNALNNVNPALPIGNLSSPDFGKSVTLSTFGPLPGAGPNAGAGNRHIELQVRLTF